MLQGKKAYICSPLSAPNPEGMQHNMELAKYYLMQMKRLYHCRTFASHAHLPLMLDDRIPEERETAMQIAVLMLDLCEVLIICGSHISEGMRSEIQTAFVKGKDIYWYDSKMKPGEPLMAFNLMKDVVDYAKKKCQETNLICKFSTTINGTLVTDEVIDFFVENTFEVKVSLDGPEYVQNLNRRDYAGTGSFEKIMKNLPLLRKYEQETGNQISVASVVTSNNYQYYAESFQFLLDLGIKKLESGIDYYCSWSDEQIQGLREQIEKVFGLYKAHIQKNQEVIFWNLWEQYLKSFLIPCPFYACKAGLTTCYVTTDGGIYTCAELPEFKIGSVEAGLDVPRIREIIYLEDQEDTMCKKCQYIRHCKTRGCQVANYEIHQNVYQPIKVNCEVTKWMYHLIQTNLTEKQLEKLKQEYERRYLRHGK